MIVYIASIHANEILAQSEMSVFPRSRSQLAFSVSGSDPTGAPTPIITTIMRLLARDPRDTFAAFNCDPTSS
jgi:hypothetical protein